MTFESWPVILKLSFLLAPFVVVLSGVAINAHMALTRDYEIAISSITSSPFLEQMKVVWGGRNLRSRCLLVGTIGGIIIFSRYHVRRGLLNPNEVRDFPAFLKRKMKISFVLTTVGCLWMLIDYLLIKR